MTEPNADRADYEAARALMDAGDLKGAVSRFGALVDREDDAKAAMPDGLAAQISCSYAVCLRDTGDSHSADFWFRTTSIEFSGSRDDEARYVAAQADFLRALMMRDADELVGARNLFDAVSMRIMLESHPAIRAVFHAAMNELKALEAKIGPQQFQTQVADEPLTYTKAANAFEKAARSWCFEADRIICTRNGQSQALPYDQIAKLHFSYSPLRFAPWRYCMTIHTKSGHQESLDNVHYVSVANFVDQSADFRKAIDFLTKQLKDKQIPVSIVSGRSPLVFVVTAILSAFLVLFLLATLLIGGPLIIIVKLAIMIGFAPTLYRWFKRNRPQRGSLDRLPPGSVPE